MDRKNNIRFCIIALIILQLLCLTACTKDDSRVVNETLTDIEGNTYKTITAGTQIWMAENLKTTKYNDGSEIPAYYYYNNDSAAYGDIYGALYSLNSVETGKLCPSGWHVSTQNDWEMLSVYLSGDSIAGGKLKEGGLAHWNIPNDDATNETGFTALPGGLRYEYPYWSPGLGGRYVPAFSSIGITGIWWADSQGCSLMNSSATLHRNVKTPTPYS